MVGLGLRVFSNQVILDWISSTLDTVFLKKGVASKALKSSFFKIEIVNLERRKTKRDHD